MAYAKDLYKQNFIEYASYVIKDRAIPDLADGLKPVQRRILHTLIEMDDGRFHKVANVVGSAMHYHPHGDASIEGALVNLANCNLFIEKQGNYGNFMTGDRAAAARYIECRLLPFTKKVLYNPEITEYVESYDGRAKEPVVFPAKIPVVLIQGTEGIAVGMSTKILPHNALEVIDAQISALKGEKYELFPDFPGGGVMDVSDYKDGLGSVLVRARLDTSNPKKIVITELPFGVDSEQMIESINAAAKKGRLKVSQVNDYTADTVNIEIYLSKGTYTKDLVDSLYAYTLCQEKISVNSLVIRDGLPHIMPVSEIVRYHADSILRISKAELEVERSHLLDRLHTRTLERIFIEERIYKRIETKKTAETVNQAILSGFEPYKAELMREISAEDIERLLKIPIRRISLFDIEKNREEIEGINAGLKQVEYNLSHLVEYSVKTLNEIKSDLLKSSSEGSLDAKSERDRKTEIANFNLVSVKEVARRDLDLRYDSSTGYIGTAVKTGESICRVSEFDKIIVIQKNGTYFCAPVSDKAFIGKEASYIGLSDKDSLDNVVFTAIYQEKSTRRTMIKRFRFASGFIMNKTYEILPDPEDNTMRKISTYPNAELTITFKGTGLRVKEKTYLFSDYRIKGVKAGGVVLSKNAVSSMRIKPVRLVEASPAAVPEGSSSDGVSVPSGIEEGLSDAQQGLRGNEGSVAAREPGEERMDIKDENEPGLFD